jgi:hypothetical protein
VSAKLSRFIPVRFDVEIPPFKRLLMGSVAWIMTNFIWGINIIPRGSARGRLAGITAVLEPADNRKNRRFISIWDMTDGD